MSPQEPQLALPLEAPPPHVTLPESAITTIVELMASMLNDHLAASRVGEEVAHEAARR